MSDETEPTEPKRAYSKQTTKQTGKRTYARRGGDTPPDYLQAFERIAVALEKISVTLDVHQTHKQEKS